jgi:hypothetical protein
MAARKSKARSPARGKAKAAAKGKSKGKSSRAASARSSRSSAAKSTRRGAAKSARGKTTARKSAAKAPARKTAAKRTAAKRAAPKRAAPQRTVSRRPTPRRTVAPRREAAPPSPPPMESPAVTEATEVPPAPPATEAGGDSGAPEGEGSDEDEPRRGGGRREAVASFAEQKQFREAVKRLLAAGFVPTDMSILASHESLELAGGVPGYSGKPGKALLAGLTDEVGLLAPLQVAGFSILGGGPIAGAVAAAVTAGLGALGLGEVIERLVSNRHAPNYVEALKAGNLLLWVRVASAAQEWQALAILGECGGANAHVAERAETVASHPQ